MAAGLAAAVLSLSAAACGAAAEEGVSNPVAGEPKAIADGRRLYRTRCVICHGRVGGRGPNLFATELSDERFLEIVINGRKGTLMPAFGYRMSPDDVWRVHAFVKSTDRY